MLSSVDHDYYGPRMTPDHGRPGAAISLGYRNNSVSVQYPLVACQSAHHCHGTGIAIAIA